MKESSRYRLAKPALFATAIIWGSTFAVAKLATEVFSAAFVNALRFSIAGICLIIVAYPKRKELDASYWWHGFVMGITLFGGYIMQTIGLTWGTTPGKSAFLSTSYCVVVPFLYWIVTKERPKWLHIACVFLCLAGIGILSLQGGLAMSKGDILTAISGIPCAANIVASSIACRKRNPLLLTAVQLNVVMLASWISVFATGTFPNTFPVVTVGSIIYLGVFATAVCLFLQTFGLKYAPPSVGGMILSLEAVFGVLFSILIYHEQITPRMLVGFAVIFVAIVLSQRE